MLKNLLDKIQRLQTAVTFAEAGERTMALEFLQEPGPETKTEGVATKGSSAAVSPCPGLLQTFRRWFETVMTVVTFAEADEADAALDLLGGKSYSSEKRAAREAGLVMQKTTALGLLEKIGGIAEAVTFAEAGEHDHVVHMLGEQELRNKASGKVLVVGRGYNFSDHLMSFATNLASRMQQEIIALNVINDEGYVRGDFQRLATNAEAFKAKALAMGIGFKHVIRSGDPGRAIRSVCNEIGQTIYALTEPEPDEARAPGEAERKWDVPVFCIVPQAAA